MDWPYPLIVLASLVALLLLLRPHASSNAGSRTPAIPRTESRQTALQPDFRDMSTPRGKPATLERKERLALLVGLGLSDLRRLSAPGRKFGRS